MIAKFLAEPVEVVFFDDCNTPYNFYWLLETINITNHEKKIKKDY